MATDQSLEHRSQQIGQGIGLILLACLAISIQDVIFKLFVESISLWQLFALRAALTLPLFGAIGWLMGQRDIFRAALTPWVLLRACLLSTTFTLFYAAVPFVSLSTLGAANYTAPIFITLLSAYLIKEPVRALGWLGVLIGFFGVLILLQPGSDAFSKMALLPLAGAVFYAFTHLVTRAKCQSATVLAMALSVNLVMLAIGVVGALFVEIVPLDPARVDQYPSLLRGWSAVSGSGWLVLAGLAVLALGTGTLLAGAYKFAPPAIIGTLEYSYLIFVAIWDLVIFNDPPTALTLCGMAMIATAGYLVIRR